MMGLKGEAGLKERLAERLQEGLPLTERPYLAIAEKLGCREETVLALADALIREGVVRSFGAFADFNRLGYEGFLCGLVVPEERIPALASRLDGRREVTHNYLRAHRVNMWFTALLKGPEARKRFMDEILHAFECPFVVLSTNARLKLRPTFHFPSAEKETGEKEAQGDRCPEEEESGFSDIHEQPLHADALKALSLLQRNFPVTPRPFDRVAEELGAATPELLDLLKNLEQRRVLRRIGVSLHHRRMGYVCNALVAWQTDIARETAGEAGSKASRFPWVSHCYVREVTGCSLPFVWPYTLYTMLHALDAQSLERHIQTMKEVLLPRDLAVLPTVRELKKTRYLL